MLFLKLSLGLGTLFTLIWLSGCGGEGGVSYRGLRCPVNHHPIEMNPESSPGQSFEKIGEGSSAPGENEELLLPPGVYQLVSVDLFFNDREEALMVHFKGAFQPTPESALAAHAPRSISTERLESRCVRGLKPQMDDLSLRLWGVRFMEVDEDGLFQNIKVGEFGFHFDGQALKATFAEVPVAEDPAESDSPLPFFAHPAQVYQHNSPRTEVNFFSVSGENKEVHYEIRTKMTLNSGAEVYMVTRLKLQEE